MKTVLGVELTDEDADRFLGWLYAPHGKFFWEYLASEKDRSHSVAQCELPEKIHPLTAMINSQRMLARERELDDIIAVRDAVRKELADQGINLK